MKLAEVIALIESSGNQYAQRFERLHLGASSPALLSRIVAANRCSQPTADVYASMSHGLYQIMGFRLYGDRVRDGRNLGYMGSVAKFLGDAALQTSMFVDYCERSGIAFSVDELISDPVKRARFAELYNGPANVSVYSTKILAAIRSGMPPLPLAPTT